MDRIRVDLVYVPEQGERPLRVCSIQDKELARKVGRRAVSEIRKKAQLLRDLDPVLSGVQDREAERLEQVLQMLGVKRLEIILKD